MSHSDNLEALILKLQEAGKVLEAGKRFFQHAERDFKELGPKRLGVGEGKSLEDYILYLIRQSIEADELERLEAVLGPRVGMGATQRIGSDSRAFTIVEVISPKKIVVQDDHAKRIDNNGLSEIQEYEYSRNPNGRRIVVTLRKNGRWIEEGQDLHGTGGFGLGFRREYSDPSF